MTRSLAFLIITVLLLTMMTTPSAGASEWQGEEVVDMAFKEAHSPQVAVDARGRAIAIWYQDVGVSTTQYRLHASVFIPGESWGVPVMMQNGDYNVNRYALDMSPDGKVLVVHLQGYRMMHVRTFDLGNGWGTDELVYSAQGINTYIGDLRLEVSSDGDAILAWTERNEGYYSLRAMLLIEGGWAEPQLIEEGSSELSEIDVALNDQGDAMAVWNVRTGDFSFEVHASNCSEGNGWSASEKISAGNDYSGTPRLGMDGDGNALVVWTQSVAENVYNVYANNFTVDSGWSLPTRIQNGTADTRAPRIAMNAAGSAVAVWQQYFGGDYSLAANVFGPGEGWLGAERLENGNWYGMLPSIGIAENGDVTVIWVPESPQAVHSIRYSAGEGWGSLEKIQSTTGWVENLDLDVGADGSAVAVWEQDDDVHAVYLPAELCLILNEPVEGSITDGTTVRVSGRTSPGAELMVNGINVHVGTDGRFSMNVSLTEGVNAISLISSTPYDEESINVTVEMTVSEEDADDPNDVPPLVIILGASGWFVAAVAIFLMLRMRKKPI